MSEEQSKIEKLQKKLYSPSAQFKDFNDRKPLHERNFDLEKGWADENAVPQESHKHGNVFKTFLALSILFFVVATGYAAYTFTNNKNVYSNDHIQMDISGPITISGGEPLKLDIHIVNDNTTPLEVVDMIVKYPEGTKVVNNIAEDLTTTREGLGDISPGETVQRTLNAVLFGEENAQKQIEVAIEYRVPNSNAIFEKKKVYDVVLSGSPIRMTVNSLKEIQANQEAQFEVTIASNSNNPIKNVLVRAEYPFGFRFKESSPSPTFESHIWQLGDLAPQQTKKIIVKGTIEGQNDEERVFKFTTGIQNKDNLKQIGVNLARVDYSMQIQKPFLAANLSIEGETTQDIVVRANEVLSARIDWQNNLPTAISDAQIEVSFAGAALNRSSIRSERGFYRSLDNTIFWNSETLPRFEKIDAGDTGQVTFAFSTFRNANGDQLFKNPEVTLNITVKGKRISDQNVPEEIKSTVTKKIKVMTDIDVYGKSLYTDGPFKNTGPFPPKPEQLTTYAVGFDVSNTANAVSNARIIAKIPSYVQWNNAISPTDQRISYDPVKRDFVWNIGDIAPGVGYASDKRSVLVHLGLVPSLSQIGASPALMTDIVFEGIDTFTGRTIRENIENINILTRDKDRQVGSERVAD